MNSLKYIVLYELQKLYADFCKEYDFQKELDKILKELKHRKV